MAAEAEAAVAPSCGASARRVAAELAAFVPRRSPAFYILRSSSALAADVAVDGMRVAYGTLSKHAFRQNALLKLLKHGLSCACCIAAGAPQGLRGAALETAQAAGVPTGPNGLDLPRLPLPRRQGNSVCRL